LFDDPCGEVACPDLAVFRQYLAPIIGGEQRQCERTVIAALDSR
jgi:hypothetical protein